MVPSSSSKGMRIDNGVIARGEDGFAGENRRGESLIRERACRVEDIDNPEQQPIVVNVYDTTQHQTIISQPQPTQTITVALPQQVDTKGLIVYMIQV